MVEIVAVVVVVEHGRPNGNQEPRDACVATLKIYHWYSDNVVQ